MSMPELGVGVIYSKALEPLLSSSADLIQVVEIEPQSLWRYTPADGGTFHFDKDVAERLKCLPQTKLVHGVGCAVGGSLPPDPRQVAAFQTSVVDLAAPWASEHLAFNRAISQEGEFRTGFLLPPLQTTAGAEAAAASIRQLARALPVPLAVETGVNYLAPRPGELSDAAFVTDVVTRADCGILLDIHNLWANERNGRQSVRDFIAEIPIDRVWEIHIAGGLEHRGYWLDAHCGIIPEPLLNLLQEILPMLTKARAIVFEILPTYVPTTGLDTIRKVIEKIHRIWDHRRRNIHFRSATSPPWTTGMTIPTTIHPPAWEAALGELVIGRPPNGHLARSLTKDPAIELLRELVWRFRAGAIVDVLRLTSRLLQSSIGGKDFKAMLMDFFGETPPELFGSSEADAFGAYLKSRNLQLDYLEEVLGFERAAIRALHERKPQLVKFPYEPMEVLEALGEGRIPSIVEQGDYEVKITPDERLFENIHGQILTTT